MRWGGGMWSGWSRVKRTWMLAGAAVALLLGSIVILNLTSAEKRLSTVPPHRYAIRSEEYRREMSVLLGPTVVGGNAVQELQNGVEIFPAMLDAISGATTSVNFETYIYWSGEIGERFTAALIERARAGVPVKVTVDWAGSIKMDAELLARMADGGVEVQRYRPLHWYTLGRLNNRTHRKLLVVDGRVAFTGGVGIADQWQGDAEDPDHWRDLHFRVEGPIAAQFQAAFNDNWVKMTGQILNGGAYFVAVPPAGEVSAQLFIASPSGGSQSMQLMYLVTIAAAVESLDIAAAYFVPDDLLLQALLQARQRGVRIRLLVPGPYTDSQAVALASTSSWGRLLAAGVQIHQYQPTMMHSKMVVADGYLVSVGSTNLDVRSLQLNDEANLNIYDAGFAGRMTQIFEADLARSTPYTAAMWKQRPWTQRLAELLLVPIRSQL
ncbi:MAG: phospholipase D-like domain-containing protein [Steroidobacteraceae bacterium]